MLTNAVYFCRRMCLFKPTDTPAEKSKAQAMMATLLAGPAILLFLLVTSLEISAQPGLPPGKTQVPDITDSLAAAYPALLKKLGHNKKMPPAFEKQILYALSYFPELTAIKIRFRLKKSTGGIIATRPTAASLLRRSSKRTYIVIINDSTEGRQIPLFANSNVNGQVGILGHELCHILYFNTSTGTKLLGLAIAHVSRKYMDRFEYNTDSVDIERGLGYQLMSWKQYLDSRFKTMHDRGTLPADIAGVSKRYMSVQQIRDVMARRQAASLRNKLH
jgi:hypothetical protein